MNRNNPGMAFLGALIVSLAIGLGWTWVVNNQFIGAPGFRAAYLPMLILAALGFALACYGLAANQPQRVDVNDIVNRVRVQLPAAPAGLGRQEVERLVNDTLGQRGLVTRRDVEGLIAQHVRDANHNAPAAVVVDPPATTPRAPRVRVTPRPAAPQGN